MGVYVGSPAAVVRCQVELLVLGSFLSLTDECGRGQWQLVVVIQGVELEMLTAYQWQSKEDIS